MVLDCSKFCDRDYAVNYGSVTFMRTDEDHFEQKVCTVYGIPQIDTYIELLKEEYPEITQKSLDAATRKFDRAIERLCEDVS